MKNLIVHEFVNRTQILRDKSQLKHQLEILTHRVKLEWMKRYRGLQSSLNIGFFPNWNKVSRKSNNSYF